VINPLRRATLLVLAAALAVGLLAGCGSSSSGGSGGSASAATKDISITYKNGQIDPPPSKIEVAEGTHVHITVTSDVAEEVHNHYNDQEIELQPGGTATFDFVATNPGVYEVELHHADKVLMQLQVG
jgi:uncharacterized cupredoxin-like copper-binding protein